MPADIRIFGNKAASGGRTRPLRCSAIRVLSSAFWRLRDVDCVSVGIGRVENLVYNSAIFYTKCSNFVIW